MLANAPKKKNMKFALGQLISLKRMPIKKTERDNPTKNSILVSLLLIKPAESKS